jgi:hypothetical protein
MSLWTDYINSTSEEEVNENWEALKNHTNMPSTFIQYLEQTWVKFKDAFVKVL